MKRPNLAQTLRAIAEDGDAAFYNGALTSSIISDLRECGKFLTLKMLTTIFIYRIFPLYDLLFVFLMTIIEI